VLELHGSQVKLFVESMPSAVVSSGVASNLRKIGRRSHGTQLGEVDIHKTLSKDCLIKPKPKPYKYHSQYSELCLCFDKATGSRPGSILYACLGLKKSSL